MRWNFLTAGHLVYLRPCSAAGHLDAEKKKRSEIKKIHARALISVTRKRLQCNSKSVGSKEVLMTYKIVVLFLKERLASLTCCKITIP